jgi:hypothetical protein
MTNKERITAIQNRIDLLLERVPDNPIYDEKDSRSLLNYLQALRALEEIQGKKTRKEE